MTDNGFSFGSFAGQTPAGRQVEAPKPPEPVHPKRTKLALGAGAAAAAVVLAAVAVVGMGGGDERQDSAVVAAPTRAAMSAPATAAPTMIPAAYKGLTGTDPFRPLVVPAAAGSVGGQAPGGANAINGQSPLPAPTVTVAVPGPTVTVSAAPVPGPTTTVTAAPTAGWTVRVVAVASDGSSADVAVNGQVEKVKISGSFGDGMFVLLGTDGSKGIALIQFGDTSFFLQAGNSLTVM